MNDALATISGNKLVCTGVPLVVQALPDLASKVSSREDFDSLVSEMYKLFREDLAGDIAFLRSVENDRAVIEFDKAIYLLRTAKQHNDNSEAQAFYGRWTDGGTSWQVSMDALVIKFTGALVQLARISSRVRRDRDLAQVWKNRANVQTELVFQAVCDDLKLTFPSRLQQALVANVNRRAKRLPQGSDYESSVKNICAQEAVAQMYSLPVPYYQLLDRLGVLGTRSAVATLLLAYSLSMSTNLAGEEFISHVEKVWEVVHAQGEA